MYKAGIDVYGRGRWVANALARLTIENDCERTADGVGEVIDDGLECGYFKDIDIDALLDLVTLDADVDDRLRFTGYDLIAAEVIATIEEMEVQQ